MQESLSVFIERLSKVEAIEQHFIGRAYNGNTRSLFVFDGMDCYLESLGFRTTPRNSTMHPAAKTLWMIMHKPVERWITGYMIYGKNKAQQVAKHYAASLSEAPYAAEEGKWFSLSFDSFEKLCQFLYDRKNGNFDKQFNVQNPQFLSCCAT